MSLFSLKNCLSLVGISSIILTYANDYDDSQEPSQKKTTAIRSEITPNASPVIEHGFDAFITADFLYWTGRQDSLDYAITGVTKIIDQVTTTPVSSTGTISSPNNKMDPGFKVGVGLDLKHDGWDSLVKYTWFHNTASDESSFTEHSSDTSWGYAPITVFRPRSTDITSTKAEWHLHFNSIDWELGRNFYISPKLLLRPHVGLKGSWQHQSYSINESLTDHFYFNAASETLNRTTTGSYLIQNEEHFWGVGIRTGLNTSWQFTDQWSLFGESSFAGLWGQFKVTREDTSTQNGSDIFTPSFTTLSVTNTNYQFHTIIPVMEFLLGVRWEYKFSNDDYRIRIQAGWEEQIWFNQSHFIHLNQNSPYGNLSLQGFTLEARIDF